MPVGIYHSFVSGIADGGDATLVRPSDQNAVHTGYLNSIRDADADTKIQVEESADEDIVRMDVAGVEAFKLSAIGELTLAKQSGGFVRATNPQNLVISAYTFILFDVNVADIQSEFDVTVKSGTARATTANHLIDNVANQFVAADVGRKVWNTTDNTYATITIYNSISDVTIDTNIMANGEGYKLFFSKFTAKEAGTYLIIGTIQLNAASAAQVFTVSICVNGSVVAETKATSYNGDFSTCQNVCRYTLAIGDYVQIACNQTIGVAEDAYGNGTNMQIQRLS